MPWLLLLFALAAALALCLFAGTRRRPPAHAGKAAASAGRPPEAALREARATRLEVAAEPAPLPSRYGVDEVVAMVKDPFQLYAYWELTGGAEPALAARLGPGFGATRRVLRIHDVDSGIVQEFALEDTHDHWWVEARPGRRYAVEVGRAGPGGAWYPLARSEVVRTPELPSAPAWTPAAAAGQPAAAAAWPGAGGLHAVWSPGPAPGSPWGQRGARS
ncbi:DUF4912 domain-containing protein [Caldinitratiruptor microaerophilus]|uniref:DUF4912 domain-containing protein n=1 Tax=Caldinitratiruptor microaerophilus TaxID=671077 RepID=A0AA35CMY7_9FIRM|nr:DUF4912 domain-containing protein [Caldinitratiruptor microaerophilus]BDG62279.1 hypothetical protein caldi_33690 [Caldinitratiruptor microaerophilus]